MISHKVEVGFHPVWKGQQGLFAVSNILAGERVWWVARDSETEVEYTHEEILALPEPYRSYFDRYCFQVDHNLFHGPARIDSTEPGSYMNHSCDPNCWLDSDFSMVARKDIPAGAELVVDYGTFWSRDYCLDPCLCGSPECRGKVGGDDYKTLALKYNHRIMEYMIED